MSACQCPTCVFMRRRKEIKEKPSFEAYESLVSDLFGHFLEEDLDNVMKIHRLEEEIKALKERV